MDFMQRKQLISDFIDYLPYTYLKTYFRKMRPVDVMRHPWFIMWKEVIRK